MCNDERWDGSQIGLELTLGLESPPKFRVSHELHDPRSNAARHINSASGAKGKRHIAGECSQESAESTKRLAAKTAVPGKRFARDFGRAKPGGGRRRRRWRQLRKTDFPTRTRRQRAQRRRAQTGWPRYRIIWSSRSLVAAKVEWPPSLAIAIWTFIRIGKQTCYTQAGAGSEDCDRAFRAPLRPSPIGAMSF